MAKEKTTEKEIYTADIKSNGATNISIGPGPVNSNKFGQLQKTSQENKQSEQNRSQMLQDHNSRTEYQCKVCLLVFDTRGKYGNHLKKHTKDEKARARVANTDFVCKYCHERFKHRQSLHRHMKKCKAKISQGKDAGTASSQTKEEYDQLCAKKDHQALQVPTNNDQVGDK